MKTVGIRELKQNASAVIAYVVSGEAVTVTSRGRAVARISPLATDTVRGLIDIGRVRAAKYRLADLPPTPAPQARARPLSDLLRELRDDERY
ncbi:MAG: type II toxin-antitoxin system Phd/YefM family antitoxin [Ilumatobacteraceae bacterium]